MHGAPTDVMRASGSLAARENAFVVGWEVQSQLATFVLIGLIAVASVWLALVTMLAWSLAATAAYIWARERGLPDLLSLKRPDLRQGRRAAARDAAGAIVKLWCAGVHTLAFARIARFLLKESPGRAARIVRLAVLALGMTLFGASTAEHLLRRAGFRGDALLRLGLVGPFLNVPYRLFLSAAVMHAAASAVHAFVRFSA